MELVILDRLNFYVKDYAYVDEEFEIVLDLVLTQKSFFKINKNKINANIGDFVYIKENDLYFGIIETVEFEKDYIYLSTVDFKELLKIEVIANSYSGNLSLYLESLIRNTLINNIDEKQNLTFLSISRETNKEGILSFDDDKIITIYELLDLVFKMYGVTLKNKVIFDNGKFIGIEIRIVNCVSGITLKADHLHLEDLVINDSNKESINKVTFYPKTSNLFFKEIITYYLLTDGSITTDKNNSLRFKKVISKLETYTDNDYLDLNDKVKNILSINRTDHQITFKINKKTTSLEVLKKLELGLLLEFLYKGKKYSSIVSAIKYHNSTDVCEITLGEYRIKLTEKIQLLNKSINSNISNITVNNSGLSDLDGGEF